MQQPGGRFGFIIPPSTERSLQDTNNPHVTVGLKAVKKHAMEVASGQTPCNIVPPHTTLMEQHLDPALFEEGNNIRHQSGLQESKLLDSRAKSSSIDNSNGDEDDDEDGDKDEDRDRKEDGEREEDESDEHTNENQYQCHDDHQELLPSQPQVTRYLTPEFNFQYSHDEDDTTAHTNLNKNSAANSQSSLSIQQNNDSQGHNSNNRYNVLSDVLAHHHKKNGQPCLPDPETLKLLHQLAEHADNQQALWRNRKTKQLHWKSFLEHTKGECCMEHMLKNLFPTFEDLPGSVTEVLIATLVAWDKEGKKFEAASEKVFQAPMSWKGFMSLGKSPKGFSGQKQGSEPEY
ncbi:uncharacterized protein EDB91DRAFT_1082176 [Suillus paluster]|uniref:uncharacterized protein n=1 Tax=Suillus paluster TaxID=48578 RepID=UPI001B869204|nr:uncharacterized protein EDB91DRAFT_1082176 [Suillus paluster]KAG1740219.1 hypothetical protein EDB91DRAFT_1082176 [Suillus paluster]